MFYLTGEKRGARMLGAIVICLLCLALLPPAAAAVGAHDGVTGDDARAIGVNARAVVVDARGSGVHAHGVVANARAVGDDGKRHRRRARLRTVTATRIRTTGRRSSHRATGAV